MKRITILIFFYLTAFISKAKLVSETRQANSFSLSGAVIYVDNADHALVRKSADLLQQDIEMVTGKKTTIVNKIPAATTGVIIVIGSIDRSSLIKRLIAEKKIQNTIRNKWEAYRVESITNPFAGFKNLDI